MLPREMLEECIFEELVNRLLLSLTTLFYYLFELYLM